MIVLDRVQARKMQEFLKDLPDDAYGSVLNYLSMRAIDNLSTISKVDQERVAKARSGRLHWISKIADDLNISPDDIILPTELDAEEVYMDVRRLGLLITKWITGTLEDGDKELVKLWTTKGGVGAIGKFLLLPVALDNYNERLPSLVDLPDPTLTKLRVRSIDVNLDSSIPKPNLQQPMVRYEDLMTSVSGYTDVVPLSRVGLYEIEYYDAHLLMTDDIDGGDILVFDNLIRTSLLVRYRQRVDVKPYIPEEPELRSLVVSRIPFNTRDLVLDLLRVFTVCKHRGITRVAIRHYCDGIQMMVYVLCAWLAGMTDIRQAVFSHSHGYKQIKDALLSSTTPREFVRKTASYLAMDPDEIEGMSEISM